MHQICETKLISQPHPLVTIGIPLYNEEKHIEEAIRSSATQCGVLWISDNASTDGSAAICKRIGREYSNVRFVRQPHNIGAIANFKFLLDKADTPFFMWLGSHDALPDGYVSQLTNLLEVFPEAVLAYGAAHHVDMNGKPTGTYGYYYYSMLAHEAPATRILGLIRHLDDCSLIHGVFRTEVLRAAWDDWVTSSGGTFIGADHILLGNAALKGPFLYDPKSHLIRRDAHPEDSHQDQLKRMDPSVLLHRQLNYREMQRWLYILATTASKGAGLAGILYRLKARLFIVKRFGPFGGTFLTRNLDTLLYLLVRI